MARPKKHPLTLALEAMKRDPSEVEHFIHEGDRLEVFFYARPTPVVPAPNNGSPYARPAAVPPSYLGPGDIDDSKTADRPIEAWDLLEPRN